MAARSKVYRAAMGLASAVITVGLAWLAVWLLLTRPGGPLASRVYPSRTQVDERLVSLSRLSDAGAREEAVRELLRALNFPERPEELQTCDLAFEELRRRYSETGDAAIPAALDKAKLGDAFGRRICDLYRSLGTDPRYRERLKTVPEAAFGLRRCEGNGLAREEIAGLLAAP